VFSRAPKTSTDAQDCWIISPNAARMSVTVAAVRVDGPAVGLGVPHHVHRCARGDGSSGLRDVGSLCTTVRAPLANPVPCRMSPAMVRAARDVERIVCGEGGGEGERHGSR